MFAKHLLKSLVSRLAPGRPARTGRAAQRFRPRLELLEDRCLLSAGLACRAPTAKFP